VDWNPLWYIITNDETFPIGDRLEFPWSHTFEEVDYMSNNMLQCHTPCRSIPWEIMLMKVYFWLLFDKDLSCACLLQGASWDSINKLSKGKYCDGWCKVMDILKQDGHLLSGDIKI
jgi:hypothetical protein